MRTALVGMMGRTVANTRAPGGGGRAPEEQGRTGYRRVARALHSFPIRGLSLADVVSARHEKELEENHCGVGAYLTWNVLGGPALWLGGVDRNSET